MVLQSDESAVILAVCCLHTVYIFVAEIVHVGGLFQVRTGNNKLTAKEQLGPQDVVRLQQEVWQIFPPDLDKFFPSIF